MTRVLSLVCLAFVLIIGAGSASARPAVAVLGLEVIDPSGTPTAHDTQVAKDLTDGLRARARAGTGPYQLAPGSDKELIDQKLLNNCDDEKPTCMATIGSQLKAQLLMFGRIQKEGKSYQVTVRVLDVGTKAITKTSTDLIPISETTYAALQGWAKKIYAKLTGESDGGTIIVNLQNAERGTILLDGLEKGNITAGSGQVGLPAGRYRLAVESDGFRRWDRDVTIVGGKIETLDVTLEKGNGPDVGGGGGMTGGGGSTGPEGGKGGNGVWKGVFVGSLVVAAGGGGWWAYNYSRIKSIEDEQCAFGARPGCPRTAMGSFNIEESNEDGRKAATQTTVGAVVMGVGLGVAAFAFYKGFIAKSSTESAASSSARTRGKRVRRERFIVTPIIAPDGGAASIRLDW